MNLFMELRLSGQLGKCYSEIDVLHQKLIDELVSELINLCCNVVDYSAIGSSLQMSSLVPSYIATV